MPADRRALGPLDTDTAPEAVANGRSAALRNVQLERGYATTVRGNVAVGNALTVLPGRSAVVGACLNPDTDGVVWLQWNDAGLHRVAYWEPGMASPAVLLTWAGLNLPARRGLTHACVLDGLLLYLDADGAVRCINLKRAMAGEYAPPLLAADPFALHLVKQPPHQAPTASREVDPSTTNPRALVNRVAGAAWQFAYQYEYPDGERTPLSPFSEVLPPRLTVAALAANSGIATDERNFIRVSYPTGALAPSPLVRAVRLLFRREDATAWQVAGEMSAGVDYDFYGESTGEVLTDAEATKLAEALPRQVGALTVAHSRPFVGDCTEGDGATLRAGDLTAVVTTAVGGGPTTSYTVYTVSIDYTYSEPNEEGFPVEQQGTRTRYWLAATGAPPDPASTYRKLGYNATTGTYYVLDPTIFNTYATAFVDAFGDEIDSSRVISSATAPVYTAAGAPPDPGKTFHDRSEYTVGVAFFDGQGRTAGGEGLTPLVVPRQDYAAPIARGVAWSLPAGTVPPAWARSYALLLSENRSASFFVQFRTDAVKQFRGNNPDGSAHLENIDANGFAATQQVWVNLGPLLTQGRGYTLSPGDRLRFVQDDGAWYEYPLLDTRGGYVAISPVAANLWFYPPAGHPLLPTTPIVEIYRPAPPLTTQLLYEHGPRYPVLSPGTGAAGLSVTSGILSGDCAFEPVPGVTEAMLPSNTQWGGWLGLDRGRPIPVVPDGARVRRRTLVRFGGVKVLGGRLNGLSSWEALDQVSLPLEAGAVTALRLAAQGQTEGQTLVALQERGTETLYLGQAPLSVAQRAQQTQLLVRTDAVVGGTNALTGGLGTRHPGSVVATPKGYVYWWCADQGEVCRKAADGANGLNSQHQCQALGRELATTYAEAEVVAGYDPRTKEYVLCFGATEQAPARTVRYSERADGFAGDVDCTPEAAVGGSNTLYAVQADQLWQHRDDAPRLTWFGVSHPARASAWANAAAGLAKTWLSLVLEGGGPLWELVAATTLDGQQTRTPAAHMALEEGKWVGPLLMDVNSPGFTGTDAQRRALYEGVPVQSETLLITLECTDTTPAARLVAAGLDFIINGGQTAP